MVDGNGMVMVMNLNLRDDGKVGRRCTVECGRLYRSKTTPPFLNIASSLLLLLVHRNIVSLFRRDIVLNGRDRARGNVDALEVTGRFIGSLALARDGGGGILFLSARTGLTTTGLVRETRGVVGQIAILSAWRWSDVMVMVRLGRRRKGNAFSAFDDGPLHGDGTVDIMKLVIETAGIADCVAGLITAPEGGSDSTAVGAHKSLTIDLMLIVSGAAVAGGGTAGAVALTVAGAGTTG